MSDFDFGNLEPLRREEPGDLDHPARWGTRGIAWLVDLLITVGVFLIPTLILFGGGVAVGDDDAGVVAVGILSLIAFLIATIWTGWFFGFRQGVTGTTPGKRQRGIRLVDTETGRPPGGARGVGRWLVPHLLNSVVGVYVVIDYLWPLWDDRNQRLTDKMFRTIVTKD